MAAVHLLITLLSSPGFYSMVFIGSCLFIFASFQIFLHPLNSYPGPITAKLSDAYNGFYAIRRELHLRTWRNHLKYGHVVRQGPNKLVFSSITALQGRSARIMPLSKYVTKMLDIYKGDRTTKPKAYIALGPGLTIPTTLTAIDHQVHRSRRQLIGQVVSERFMRLFEPIMINEVDLFIRRLSLAAQESYPVNVTEYARHLGLDLAGLLAFGYNLHLQTNNDNRFILPMLDAGAYWSGVFLQWPFSRHFRAGLIFVKIFRTVRTRYLSLMETMITSRVKQHKDAYQDLYKVVADSLHSEDGGLRNSELWAEANLFLPAAGDTTKTALSAVFFYLSRFPACYKKLTDEIRSNFTSGSEIKGQPLTGCTYLRACIDEALRLSPPAPGILWRDPLSGSGTQPFIVEGSVIPPGTIVGVNIYSIHRNPEYFPDPFTYHPERWLDDSISPERKKIMRDAFVPFSLGPRGCAGKAMAYLEISLVIAKTLWYFDFHTASGNLGAVGASTEEPPNIFMLFDNFTASHDGPYLTFQHRQDAGGDFSKAGEDVE
ncbi:cytochrome P450 [Xylaria sp. FL1777]|nr:cytochrome P450 [Xylaria sp. FL1777]